MKIRHSPEQIEAMLRQADTELGKGSHDSQRPGDGGNRDGASAGHDYSLCSSCTTPFGRAHSMKRILLYALFKSFSTQGQLLITSGQ